MPSSGWFHSVIRALVLLFLIAAFGCESTQRGVTSSVSSANRAGTVISTRLAANGSDASEASDQIPSSPVGPNEIQSAEAIETMKLQVPDPLYEPEAHAKLLERELARLPQDDPEIPRKKAEAEQRLKKVLERTDCIQRANSVRLTLKDAIRRALENSYTIKVQGYNPAIESTRIVEAEAQFDAVFFANITKDKQDRPTPSQLAASFTDIVILESGIRKLLSSGMQVQASYGLTRTKTNLAFATLNPSYFNQFAVEFRQPFLRGFGLDFNRAQIEISQLDRTISLERLRREIRETLFNVEQAYWRLIEARRNVNVIARLLAELETILDSLQRRAAEGFDVYEVQLKLPESRIEQRKAELIRLCNDVRNAEDALKALMNDPDLNLSQDLEIIPAEKPSIEPLIVDQLGEVTAALSHREEMREAMLAIKQAEIAVGVAKNQALPRLDVAFRYVVNGLGGNADSAFSQLSDHDFVDYLISVEFEWPIGNRGPEAALRRARLQQAQAIAAHRAQIESTILEVRQSIRDLKTSYDQIGPNLRAALASEDQLRATRARQEKRDPPNLQVELDANESLAASRQQLLRSVSDYNIALIDLERKKGTLLRYNNIVIRDAEGETLGD